MIIPTGSKCLDFVLGGGVETGTITQFYGQSGTGKTSICLVIAKAAAKIGEVAYIDTEGISGERVRQIFDDTTLLSKIYTYEVYSFRQQSSAVKEVEKLCRKSNLKLVIVDSFTGLYRCELEEEKKQIRAKRELTSQLTFLLGVARKFDVAVVITNQMFTDVKSGEDKPLGGTSVDHLSKVIIALERIGEKRIAKLVKHRWLKEGRRCEFTIVDRGIEP